MSQFWVSLLLLLCLSSCNTTSWKDTTQIQKTVQGWTLPVESIVTNVPDAPPTVAMEARLVTIISTSTPSPQIPVVSTTISPTGCYSIPVSPNTPTAIAGCERWGIGVASHYGAGTGVAMNFCTWTFRHTYGCGFVTIKSLQSGLTVTAPVIDFCDCYTGTADERVIDLQWSVVESLGLSRSQGLYEVEVWPAN